MKASELPVLKVEYLMTRKCQFGCSYCKIVDDSNCGSEMGTLEVLQMIDNISVWWPGAPIIFFGGEPTTRDDLPVAIAECSKKGVKHAVISNSKRIMEDSDYTDRLISSGLSNWSISYDGDSLEVAADSFSFEKSSLGLSALRLMRDEYGIRDLVACITVTKRNIESLPRIVEFLTKEGIWSICTPLQTPDPIFRYRYSSGDRSQLPTKEQISSISSILTLMARSGNYLMHNDPEWFQVWNEGFLTQTWKCSQKSGLTVDADGCLLKCVDIPLKENIHVNDLCLESVVNLYYYNINLKHTCSGCLWDPAYETILRANSMPIEDGRKTFRHELTEQQIENLLPEAQKWMRNQRDQRP